MAVVGVVAMAAVLTAGRRRDLGAVLARGIATVDDAASDCYHRLLRRIHRGYAGHDCLDRRALGLVYCLYRLFPVRYCPIDFDFGFDSQAPHWLSVGVEAEV
jgi:hypothetical protein